MKLTPTTLLILGAIFVLWMDRKPKQQPGVLPELGKYMTEAAVRALVEKLLATLKVELDEQRQLIRQLQDQLYKVS